MMRKIPVEFSVAGAPVIEIKAEDRIYKAMIDLGASTELAIQDFSSNNLTYLKKTTSINVLGEESESDTYAFSEYKIGNNIIPNAFLLTDKFNGADLDVKGGALGNISRKNLANIGYPLVYRTNLFFDLPNSALWLVDSDQDLKKCHLRLEEYEKIPFLLGKWGITVIIETDLGNLKFLVDTGASVSLFQSNLQEERTLQEDSFANPCFQTTKFTLGNSNYGLRNLYPFPFTSRLHEFDAILGMDFLKEHAFYIDYPNRLIYFQKPKAEYSKPQQGENL